MPKHATTSSTQCHTSMAIFFACWWLMSDDFQVANLVCSQKIATFSLQVVRHFFQICIQNKAVLRQSFSTCVFRMQLCFQVCWKLTSVATVFCFLQFRLNHSILLKYTNVDINASSKLKTNDILAQNAAFWVFNRNFSISWKHNVLLFQTLKSHIFAVNACVKRQSQRALNYSQFHRFRSK